jgi:hypothetical protein
MRARRLITSRSAPTWQQFAAEPSQQRCESMQWHIGNAARDGADKRGWFIGPFLNPDAGVRASPELEIKWSHHYAHERRSQRVTHETRTTVLILINGKCRIELSTGSFILSSPAEYAMWGPGIDHAWEVLEDSTMLTVRWRPADTVERQANQ